MELTYSELSSPGPARENNEDYVASGSRNHWRRSAGSARWLCWPTAWADIIMEK